MELGEWFSKPEFLTKIDRLLKGIEQIEKD
jgi:hypothetical protein